MEERFLGQLLLCGVPGPVLDPETAAILRRIKPGGFILFGRNIQTPEQLRKLTDDLRDLCEFEPVITIDQEGGRVSRLKLIGNEPPNAVQLREKGDPSLIREHGLITGELLRLFGFNLDLCPVLDLSPDESVDNSLRGRTWGTTVAKVIENAGLFNAALRKSKILSCGKHFPGYGGAECDPHHELPFITKSLSDLEKWDLAPYHAMLPELDSVMVCHSHYTAFDADKPRWPASLSENIIRRYLRDQLGYKGLVMTDDLDMGAILNEVGFGEAIRQSVIAGNDLVMICHRLEMVEEAKGHLATLPEPILQMALENVERFKRKLAPPTFFSLENHRALDERVWKLRVNTLGEEAASQRSPEDGKRSPVEVY